MWMPIKSRNFPFYLPTQPFPSHLSWQPDKDDIHSLPSAMEECDSQDWSIANRKYSGSLYFSSIRNDEFDRTMTLLRFDEEDEESEDESFEPTF